MNSWDSHTLVRLRQVAIDLTTLSASVEVMRSRLPQDEGLDSIAAVVERLILHVNAIVEQLRER